MTSKLANLSGNCVHVWIGLSVNQTKKLALYTAGFACHGHQTKCVHAQKFKSYAAPLNFSVCTHAVGDFN